MAKTMQFDLVSPERRIVSMEADTVELPGSEGDMTILADHAALVTTLRPGIIRTKSGDNMVEHVVTGGFVEVTAEGMSVLAERVYAISDATSGTINSLADEEAKAAEALSGARRDAADTRIACLKALAGTLN